MAETVAVTSTKRRRPHPTRLTDRPGSVELIVSIGTRALFEEANYRWVKHLTRFQVGGTVLEPLAPMVS